MKISIDEVHGIVQKQSELTNETMLENIARRIHADVMQSNVVRVDEMEVELRIRAERRARLTAD